MKRKAVANAAGHKPAKKRSKSNEETQKRFRAGLFDNATLSEYRSEYAASTPYKHAVISNLVDDTLLRKVRAEIEANVSFTPKETDIYKIHQSGDLANLDGLDDAALAKLPSLLVLRDALYSPVFRDYVSGITGCGPLSGRKTDMAVNIYTPGCYLLCHDDVIGSRRVSYILYLVDPETPWQPSWGGALRLFPVTERAGADGVVARAVEPDVIKVIPPAWNQLSFFAVQPGLSFHDVEEVYRAASADELERDGGRIRMAISGWFHIPQAGEPGYVAGAQEENERNSGLMQLQGNPDQHDLPQAAPVPVDRRSEKEGKAAADEDEVELDEADLEFLLRYLAPTYLTPETLERLSDIFEDESSITLPDILSAKFADRLRRYIEAREAEPLPQSRADIESAGPWKVARPPHKHRFLYLQPGARADAGKKEKEKEKEKEEDSPVRELLEVLLPSRPFRLWLQMATRTVIESHDLVARRFRRGMDYTLATGHEGKPRLELNIGLTPTTGWGDDGADDDEDDEEEEDEDDEAEEEDHAAVAEASTSRRNGAGKKADDQVKAKTKANGSSNGAAAQDANGKSKSNAKGKGKGKAPTDAEEDAEEDEDEEDGDEDEDDDESDEDYGGHEVYMAGDEDAGADAAVYNNNNGGSDDDNILFFQAAAWNKMTLVVRDSGTLRFVKYVSAGAPGDRWDVSGTFEIEGQDDDDDDDDEGQGGEDRVGVLEEDEEEEFRGFSPSEESESD